MKCGAGFPGGSNPREQGRNGNVFYDLVSEITYHHFVHIWLVIQTNTDIMLEETIQGYKYQETRLTRGHLGGGYHNWGKK